MQFIRLRKVGIKSFDVTIMHLVDVLIAVD
jgi:hypothetical protein